MLRKPLDFRAMKEVPNNQFTETESTVTMLKFALQQLPHGGFTFEEARARNRISDALEKVEQGGVITLEDSDHAKAVEILKGSRWGGNPKHLTEFAKQWGL